MSCRQRSGRSAHARTGEPLTVFWTTHDGCLWDPYRRCSDQIPEKTSRSFRVRLIFLWEHKLLVVVEAKFRSPNRSDKRSEKTNCASPDPISSTPRATSSREGAEEAVRDGWYELLRNWVAGHDTERRSGLRGVRAGQPAEKASRERTR